MKRIILSILAILGIGGAGVLGVGFYNRTSNPTITIGSVVAKTVTTTLTAAEVCNSNVITVTAVTSTPRLTFPATTTLFSNCLGVDGNTRELTIINLSAATSTYLTTGAGGTINAGGTGGELAASQVSSISVVRQSSSAYKIISKHVGAN